MKTLPHLSLAHVYRVFGKVPMATNQHCDKISNLHIQLNGAADWLPWATSPLFSLLYEKTPYFVSEFDPNMVLTTEERVWLVKHVFRKGDRYTDVVRERFAEKFPNTPAPHRNAVRNIIDKFHETGSVVDAKRCGRPTKLSEEKLLDISDSMRQSPSKSLRKLAQQHDIGLGTAHKAVRKIQNNGGTRTESN